MRFFALVLSILLFLSPAVAREFQGEATISIIELTPTTLKVCSPNQKYIMAPGTSRIVKLGVRNIMNNKTVARLVMAVDAAPDLQIAYFPRQIENLTPDDAQYFDVNVTVPKGTPYGNHQIRFLVGTDEYAVGAFEFPVLIKVRSYGSIIVQGTAVGAIVLMVLAVLRAVCIYGANRSCANRKPKSGHRSKKNIVSLKYYDR